MTKPVANLPYLHVFACVARHRNMTRAAEELCITQSAVSHQIRSLEQQLGQRLFDRQRSPLALTQAGDSLFRVVDDALERIAHVCQHLQAPTLRSLRVTAQTSIAVEWLAPRLHQFQQLHPQIEVRLHMESNAASLALDQTDVIVGTWPCPVGFRSQAFGPEWWFPVFNPHFEAEPQSPAQLLKAQLVTSEQGADWQLWAQQLGLVAPPRWRWRHVTLALLAYKSVAQSPGFALSNAFVAGDAIARGELVALTKWRYQLPWGQYHIHTRAYPGSEAVTLFCQWLHTVWQQTRLHRADGEPL